MTALDRDISLFTEKKKSFFSFFIKRLIWIDYYIELI